MLLSGYLRLGRVDLFLTSSFLENPTARGSVAGVPTTLKRGQKEDTEQEDDPQGE